MEIFFTILIMTLVVSLSGVVTRVLPFQVPLPLMQIAIGALLAWPTFGLHVEFDPELFLVLFIPPLLFADGWKTPTREFIEHGREILGLVTLAVAGRDAAAGAADAAKDAADAAKDAADAAKNVPGVPGT